MFKGIIKQMQSASVAPAPELSAEAFFDLREVYEYKVAAREQLDTLKNAKALKSALEQYGATSDGYRALMAFADASGELSAAFGVSSGAALESLSDAEQLTECGTIVSGLESFIAASEAGEDTASVEGLREVLNRNKKALTALVTVAAAGASMVSGKNPLLVTGGVALATAASLYVANKIANKGRVDGSYAEAKAAMEHANVAADILRKLVALVPEDPAKAADAADKLVAQKADFAKIGFELDTDGGRIELKAIKGFKSPKMTMVPFNESGWTAENLKALASEYGKQSLAVRATADALMDKYSKISSDQGLTNISGTLSSFYNCVDAPCEEADWTLYQIGRTLKSAAKFFTAKKE